MRQHLKFLLSLLLITGMSTLLKAQSPSGKPNTKSNGWLEYGYVQGDSGIIVSLRDTNWRPRFAGTLVYWRNAGVDSVYWGFNGKTSGKRWDKLGASKGVDTVFVDSPLVVTFNTLTGKQTISMYKADGTKAGYLSASQYNLFFNKVDSSVISKDSLFDWRNGSSVNIGAVGSVKWFNLADNGSDITGNTDASALINSAISNGARVIYFPKGTKTLIGNTIIPHDSVTFIGDGILSQILINGNYPGFKLTKALGGQKCRFINLGFTGTWAGSTTETNQNAISLDSMANILIDNIYTYKMGGYGVKMRNNGYCCGTYPLPTGVLGNIVTNCFFDSSYGGVKVDTLSEYNNIANNQCNRNYIGIFKAGGNNRISSNSGSGNIYGLYVVGTGNNGHGLITDNVFNHNGKPLYMENVTWGDYFVNNTFYTDYDSIIIKNSKWIIFIGGFMTASGANSYITFQNCDSCAMIDVGNLLGLQSKFSITGTQPTIIKHGLVPNTISILDYVNNTRGDIKFLGNKFSLKGASDSANTYLGVGTENIDSTFTTAKGVHIRGGGLFENTINSNSLTAIHGQLNSNSFVFSHDFVNTNASSGAGIGWRYTNNSGHEFYGFLGSSTNGLLNDAAFMRTNGNGGFKLIADGTHAPFNFANNQVGAIYARIFSDSLQHNNIPAAPNMTGKQVLVYDPTGAGNFYKIPKDSVVTSTKGTQNYAHSIFTPTTGGTVSLVNNQYNIINPVGALLALTVNLPSSPANNDVVYIKFTQNITTVTYSNGTVVDGITAPTAGGLTVLVYDSNTTSWY